MYTIRKQINRKNTDIRQDICAGEGKRLTAGEVLKQYFGYDEFRPGQTQIIEAVLANRDVLGIMPTGAGKSVCYQVPALMLPGITIVVSPLISLMQDQVKALNAVGVHAAYINSSLTEGQITKALSLASKGVFKIIYVAPERLESWEFLSFARQADISMLTVDEAHCISQWGQDFRPSYLKITGFIRELAKRPVISTFTATATEEVKEDICCILGLRDPYVCVTGFDRPNLYFEVEHVRKKDDFVLQYLREHKGDSGIIYCATRKNVDNLYALLLEEDVSAARYHAGMGTEERKTSQDDFVYDRISVMVATNAFGMGIDKSNVRFVLHYNMPQSMENYYQEAGRAGRDGEEADCILLFSPQDVIINRYLLEHKDFSAVPPEDVENIRQRDAKRLRIMENYCTSSECLRKYILNYFGEEAAEACGNCSSCRKEFVEIDVTREAAAVIQCVREARSRFGIQIIIGALQGRNRARLKEVGAVNWKSYGLLGSSSEDILKKVIHQLTEMGYLRQTQDQYSVLQAGALFTQADDPDFQVTIRMPADQLRETASASTSSAAGKDSRSGGRGSLTSSGFRLFEELRTLRSLIARRTAMPPYIIFTDRTLIDMCIRLPQDKAQMMEVSGVAAAKFEKYGEEFLNAVRSFVSRNPGAVTSFAEEDKKGQDLQDPDDGTQKTSSGRTGKKKNLKADFALHPADAGKFSYQEFYYVSEIAKEMNEINTAENMKKLQTGQISEFLKESGLILDRETGEEDAWRIRETTEKGEAAGIITLHKTAQNGTPYTLLQYPENVQRMIVEHFTQKQPAESVMEGSLAEEV